MSTPNSPETPPAYDPYDHHAEPAALPWEMSVQLLGLMVVVLLLALLVAPLNDPFAPFREGRFAGHASAIVLTMAAAFAFAAFLLHAPARTWRLFWLVCACAFVFLALDELLLVREQVGAWLTGIPSRGAAGGSGQSNVIVSAYGAMALLFTALAIPEIRASKGVAVHLAVGMGFFVAHAVLRTFVAPSELRLVLEESCKVLANTCFALAMLAGLLSAAQHHAPARAVPPPALDFSPDAARVSLQK